MSISTIPFPRSRGAASQERHRPARRPGRRSSGVSRLSMRTQSVTDFRVMERHWSAARRISSRFERPQAMLWPRTGTRSPSKQETRRYCSRCRGQHQVRRMGPKRRLQESGVAGGRRCVGRKERVAPKRCWPYRTPDRCPSRSAGAAEGTSTAEEAVAYEGDDRRSRGRRPSQEGRTTLALAWIRRRRQASPAAGADHGRTPAKLGIGGRRPP